MDLITYALAKKYTDSKVVSVAEGITPQIGENGNWIIAGIDTGISATPKENVEVDGILKVDSENRVITVTKDGESKVISEYSEKIGTNQINALFEE